ncbi:MAG: 5-methylcytosine-specific restriction enzyme A [uncultured Sulfurovum sp.]|uniref:5-methylcytosine-specific restriction enzyme A n=1 Tax=uncultured Sulfurovum sp. TaxID=269237 RepID=A0A6S6TPG9_9BACT|nr:MAG: 5-methylcytosine-specific restriction enzyme A [uncultured Sulfurovum sp.]
MNKKDEACLILGINPNKWFDENSDKNCKVNKKLKKLTEHHFWIGNFSSENIFKGMKGIIKVGHDNKRGEYCKDFQELKRGIYATFEVIEIYKEDKRIHLKVIDNFFLHNEIVTDSQAINILGEEKFNLIRKSADIISFDEYQKIRNIFFQNLRKDRPSKRKKQKYQKVKIYDRNIKIRDYALELANFKCELNTTHKSFVSNKNGKEYMESHHLLPLKAYSYPEFKDINLDVVSNIISLCPNCHRLMHYGLEKEVVPNLVILLEDRVNRLKSAGIYITIEELKSIYLESFSIK